MASPVDDSTCLVYKGANFLRQRLLLAALSGRNLRIKNIRSSGTSIGLQDFEANLVRLIDKFTNGSIFEINETGTELYFEPGLLIGGTLEHDCSTQRSIGYYLEVLFCLAPFAKHSLNISLTGVTNDNTDPSVDWYARCALPVLAKFLGTDEGLKLEVQGRGAAPGGGGRVLFTCPVRLKLRPLALLAPGKIRRVRGVAYAVRCSPSMASRVAYAARGVLRQYIPDIYIHTDHWKGPKGGKSPGFGCHLYAESTSGVVLGVDLCSEPPSASTSSAPVPRRPSVPEDIGRDAAYSLMEEIYRGGCCSSSSQGLTCLLMVLGQQDVSKVLFGELTPNAVQVLRHIKDFMGAVMRLEYKSAIEVAVLPQHTSSTGKEGDKACDAPAGGDSECNVHDVETDDLALGGPKILATCVGIGYTNMNKQTM